MDDLIKQIQERTGLGAEKVAQVVTMTVDFMKDNLPDDLVDQVTRYLSTAVTLGGDAATGAKGAAETAGGVASDWVSKATGAVSSLLNDDADNV